MTTKSKISIALAAVIAFTPGSGGLLDALLRAPGAAPGAGVVLAAQAPTPQPGEPPPKPEEPTPADQPPKVSPYLQPDIRPSQPLSLEEAIQRAVENNLDVSISRMDPESARFGVTGEEAFFDPLLNLTGVYERAVGEPQTSFDATEVHAWRGSATWLQTLEQGFHYELTWRSGKSRSPSLFNIVNPAYDSNLFFTFRQPLLRGFGFGPNTTGIEIAKLDVGISEESFRVTVIETLRITENAYWDLAAAIASLRVARESLTLANDLLELNRKKVEVGTLAPIQITEAEAGVASREEGVIIAQADIKNAEDTLRRIMNVPPDSPDWGMAIEPTTPAGFEPTEIDLDAMIKAALADRPELRQARQTVQANDLRHRLTENNRKIALDAIGTYGLSGNNYDRNQRHLADIDGDGTPELVLDSLDWQDSASEVFTNDIRDWTVGLNASIPIGNRGAKATEARARIAFEQSQMSLTNLERVVEVEVRIAARAVETGVKRVQSARTNVNLQEKKLEAEQKRYENGMSTSFQVLTFQNDLTAARSAVISALVAYHRALVALAALTATLPEKRGVTIASSRPAPSGQSTLRPGAVKLKIPPPLSGGS